MAMIGTRSWLLFTVIALAFGATGCGGGGVEREEAYLVPEDPGLYALKGEGLQRLDGNVEWENETWGERSNLAPSTQFVIYDPALAHWGGRLDETIRLYRVVWTRSEITEGGNVQPATGSRWRAASSEEYLVPLNFDYVAGRPDIVRAVPAQPLEAGLYSFQVHSDPAPVYSRLGVDWPLVDEESYAAETCVDVYLGSPVEYRPCAAQGEVLATKGLRLHLVSPETRTINGTRTMVIQGVVINESQQARRLPLLEARLRGADGSVLKQWQFTPKSPEIGASGSVPFRTEVENPPYSVHDVHVSFAPSWSSTLVGQ